MVFTLLSLDLIAKQLRDTSTTSTKPKARHKVRVIVQYPEPYVQPLVIKALHKSDIVDFDVIDLNRDDYDGNDLTVEFRAYEELDFERAMTHSTTSLVCAYVIRKALIRKHYLANTVSTWLTKHPDSTLGHHFKPSVHLELDYAEFLDDSLVDAWDLHESMTRNDTLEDASLRDWWILKPGMSDGGNGLRLFSILEELQAIFEEWDPQSDEEEDGEEADDDADTKSNGEAAMTSQLRHFLVQPYISNPLLLPAYDRRKFHIRTYVLAVGALKVFVYKEMLALFAAKPYVSPGSTNASDLDLAQHLTNTCFQGDSTKESSVHRFWALEDASMDNRWLEHVFAQVCQVTGEVFEAAAKEQMIHFQVIPNAFEVFGVDFLVDEQQNVWLLELNAYPDFKQTGSDLQQKVVGGLFEGIVRTAVEPFFSDSLASATDDDAMVLVKDIDLGRR